VSLEPLALEISYGYLRVCLALWQLPFSSLSTSTIGTIRLQLWIEYLHLTTQVDIDRHEHCQLYIELVG
jgi:hypothetical protein